MVQYRVFIADDHPLTLAGVRAEIERAGDSFVIAGEAASGKALLALLEQASLARSAAGCLLVTDFSMRVGRLRECDGINLLQTLRRQFPLLPVIVLTEIGSPAMLRAMVESGVRGLVDKVSAPNELLVAIQRVAAGRIHFCQRIRAALDQAGGAEKGVRISPHEAEVIRLFVGGLTVSEIAVRLSRSVKTISRQKSDAMQKLGVENNSQLYGYARDHGLS
ncbi:MAG: response regulator transcription factor [Luteimonas sp.]